MLFQKTSYTIEGVTFTETSYTRNINGRSVTREYAAVKHIKIGEKVFTTAAAIGYAKANMYQRAVWYLYDCHHANHCHEDNRLSNIRVMKCTAHRRLHKREGY